MIPFYCKLEGHLYLQDAQGYAVPLAARVHPRAAWDRQYCYLAMREVKTMQVLQSPSSNTHASMHIWRCQQAPLSQQPSQQHAALFGVVASQPQPHLCCCETMASTAAHSSTMPHTWEAAGEGRCTCTPLTPAKAHLCPTMHVVMQPARRRACRDATPDAVG